MKSKEGCRLELHVILSRPLPTGCHDGTLSAVVFPLPGMNTMSPVIWRLMKRKFNHTCFAYQGLVTARGALEAEFCQGDLAFCLPCVLVSRHFHDQA